MYIYIYIFCLFVCLLRINTAKKGRGGINRVNRGLTSLGLLGFLQFYREIDTAVERRLASSSVSLFPAASRE